MNNYRIAEYMGEYWIEFKVEYLTVTGRRFNFLKLRFEDVVEQKYSWGQLDEKGFVCSHCSKGMKKYNSLKEAESAIEIFKGGVKGGVIYHFVL